MSAENQPLHHIDIKFSCGITSVNVPESAIGDTLVDIAQLHGEMHSDEPGPIVADLTQPNPINE